MFNSYDSMDCSLPGSSVHGILQARILSGLPFPSPGDISHPGIEPGSPALQTEALPTGKSLDFGPNCLSYHHQTTTRNLSMGAFENGRGPKILLYLQ